MNIFSNIFNKTKDTKKIISFDGGGVRAIAGVVFLKKLEAASGKKHLIFLICLLELALEHLMLLV